MTGCDSAYSGLCFGASLCNTASQIGRCPRSPTRDVTVLEFSSLLRIRRDSSGKWLGTRPSQYYQPSPYARALAEQQQQRARAALAQERERQRLARFRYFPDGYDEPESDEEDYYLTPRQRALLDARRRQEAAEQHKQEAARIYREQQQARAGSTSPPQSTPRRSASPSPAEHPKVSQTSSSSPSPQLLAEAATKIQTQYRIHRALRAISDIASKFETLKASFVPPTTIDFQSPDGSIVPVPVPASVTASPSESAKLAFTPTNVPLHTYAELLSRLLVALDAVESRGDRRVREHRRSVVRAIEGEAGHVEALWRGVWAAHQEQQQRADEEEVCAMVVDEAALPELAAPESDSDVEPELTTPPMTPAESPKLVLDLEPAEDAVVVNIVPEDEKVPGEDFVIV
ncbi:hypothetical protein C8R44DRAFT_7346 [Mycena epipterygia]|nr:hypothetical protein C8R44DRAFT_7346 [Mycena epipterygia]